MRKERKTNKNERNQIKYVKNVYKMIHAITPNSLENSGTTNEDDEIKEYPKFL